MKPHVFSKKIRGIHLKDPPLLTNFLINKGGSSYGIFYFTYFEFWKCFRKSKSSFVLCSYCRVRLSYVFNSPKSNQKLSRRLILTWLCISLFKVSVSHIFLVSSQMKFSINKGGVFLRDFSFHIFWILKILSENQILFCFVLILYSKAFMCI